VTDKRKKKSQDSTRKATALRLPLDLLTWVKDYARNKNTTVTQIIIDHFTDLRARHEGTHVDQI